MTQQPPLHELEFLKTAPNFRELEGKLLSLGIPAPILFNYGKYLSKCWFELAEDHLLEAREALKAGLMRTVFSRSYYAAYNASKATRYLVKGWMSLKGDDHAQASIGLPDDFPDVALWAQRITTLQQHRLRADYDNWSDTTASHTLIPADTVGFASAFIDEARSYLNIKFGKFL